LQHFEVAVEKRAAVLANAGKNVDFGLILTGVGQNVAGVQKCCKQFLMNKIDYFINEKKISITEIYVLKYF